MGQQLDTGDVLVELHDDGAVTLHWPPVGVTVGPWHAWAVTDQDERSSAGDGAWAVEPADAFGRPGTWARWRSPTGIELALHVPSRGDDVIVEVTLTVADAQILERLVPLDGPIELAVTRHLVDGYDSWAYSGFREGGDGSSWWNTALVTDDGRALVFQALDARRWCTRIDAEADRVRVECGAPPSLVPVPDTWGDEAGPTPPLGLPLAAGTPVQASPLAIAASSDALATVERLAGLASGRMGARRWGGAPVRGWESWYHYGLAVGARDVLANARALRTRYRDVEGFDLVQIDDGWQQTYGAWWPNDRFPADLGELVAELTGLGCRAGIWVAPFRVQPGAPGHATDHPDWMLHDADGRPVEAGRHGAWALDASHPDARGWIAELGATIRAWGFDMVKVDFCYLGALEAQRHDPRMTGIETMRAGMQALADGLGDDVYLLGCGLPVLPAVGICHGNRVGHDLAMPREHQALGHPLDDGWTGFMGVRAGARNLAARWAHAGRWYDADVDVVMAWGSDGADPAGFGIEEARVLATVAALSGGPFLLADDLDALTATEHAVLEDAGLLALVGARSLRPVDLFAAPDPASVARHAFSQGPGIPGRWTAEVGDRTVVALFNWGDEPAATDLPAGHRGATELWTGAPGGARVELPPRSVRVFTA